MIIFVLDGSRLKTGATCRRTDEKGVSFILEDLSIYCLRLSHSWLNRVKKVQNNNNYNKKNITTTQQHIGENSYFSSQFFWIFWIFLEIFLKFFWNYFETILELV
jgi:hypothetical protein